MAFEQTEGASSAFGNLQPGASRSTARQLGNFTPTLPTAPPPIPTAAPPITRVGGGVGGGTDRLQGTPGLRSAPALRQTHDAHSLAVKLNNMGYPHLFSQVVDNPNWTGKLPPSGLSPSQLQSFLRSNGFPGIVVAPPPTVRGAAPRSAPRTSRGAPPSRAAEPAIVDELGEALRAFLLEQQRFRAQEAARQRAFRNQTRQSILGQIEGASQIPTADDPTIAPQIRAGNIQDQRAFERFQRQQAEQAAALGLLNSGARDVELEGFQQAQGEAAAGRSASLVAGELGRRRDELVRLLGLAANIQDQDLTRQLSERISLVDAELTQQLGLADLALRSQLGNRGLSIDQQLGLSGLGVQNRGLDIQRELGLGGLNLGFSQLAQQSDQNTLDALIEAWRSGRLG